MELGEREIIYLSLHCHHQNDFCIKVGSDESHFNVSVAEVMDKVTGQCPQTTTFLKRKESRSGYRTEVLPLTNLTPYRWATPAHFQTVWLTDIYAPSVVRVLSEIPRSLVK